ncbi:hypothetical protein ACOMHN_021564 [Nucella lapillus]
MRVNSIQPGTTVGDPQVPNPRASWYSPDGKVAYIQTPSLRQLQTHTTQISHGVVWDQESVHETKIHRPQEVAGPAAAS